MNKLETWLERPQTCRWAMCFGAIALVALRARYGISNIQATAYEIFVIARNLAHGDGLVFNLGDHILSVTSPLYAVILGLLDAPFKPELIPWISVWVNILFDLGSFWVLQRWVWKATGSRWAGTVGALVFALNQRVIEFSSGGKDTSIYIFCVLCAFRALQEPGETRLGLFTGLVAICRPEGGMVAALLLPFWAWRNRRWPWRATWIAGGVFFTYETLILLYYVSPIPQTMIKMWYLPNNHMTWGRLHIVVLFGAQAALALYGRFLWWFWHRWAWGSLCEAVFWLGLFAGQIGLFAWSIWRLSKRDGSVVAAAVYVCLHAVLFCMSDVPMILGNYEVPLEPLWAMGLVSAWWLLTRNRRFGAAIWGPLLLASQIFAIAMAGGSDARWLLADHFDKGLERALQRACQAVKANGLKPTDTVMAEYYDAAKWNLNSRVLDMYGEVYPQALNYAVSARPGLGGASAASPALVMDARPRYLICPGYYAAHYYRKDPRFVCAYRLLTKEKMPFYPAPGARRLPPTGYDALATWLEVYVRRDEEEIRTNGGRFCRQLIGISR